MSYSRLPLAMAQDGMLPKFFARTTKKSGAAWVSIIFLASCWALCLGLGFQRLITLDIMLYGGSLSLEFITLIVLRIREPHLKREFKVPGGMAGAVTLGIFPIALLALAMIESEHESILGMNGLLFGVIIIAIGVLGYAATKRLRQPSTPIPTSPIEQPATGD
jgi:amino acid transporter